MAAESRRERQKRKTRARILASAVDRFSKQGFEATSLRDVSDDLDVSIPTLRNYFGTKDGLLLALVERFARAVERGVDQVVDKGVTDPNEALSVAVGVINLAHGLPRDLLAHIMRIFATESGATEITERLLAALERIIRYGRLEAGGRADLEDRRLAQIVYDLVTGAMIDWAQTPEVSGRATIELVLSAALEMAGHQTHTKGPAEWAQQDAGEAPGRPEASTRSELPGRIRNAARRRFAEQGVRETTLESIADELAIATLTISYHFGSKDGLLASIAADIADQFEATVDEALASEEETDLDRILRVIPPRIAALPNYGSKLTAELLRVTLTHPEGVAASRRIQAAMIRLALEGQRRGLLRRDRSAQLMARIALDLCYGSLLRWLQTSEKPSQQTALETMQTILLFVCDDD